MTALSPGTRLGPYEITASIGAGGMGTVYRARDSRLGRDVALKVGAERFSERFEREARAVAALNHPNISTLFDIGPNYLVMEMVEGETLAERIRQGPIPVDDAVRIASQIAEALAAAHEAGIVHRDLKPGNVMVKADGAVKVLDFGLAKNVGGEAGESQAGRIQDSPTLSQLATQEGVILGTAAYSSTGHLTFMRRGALLAVPFDAARVELSGAAAPLLAGLMHSVNAPNGGEETGMGQYAISPNGTLLYATGDVYPARGMTMVRVDLKGNETELAEIKGAGLFGLRLSRDGKRLAALRTGEGSRASDLWLYGLPAATGTRLTSNGLANWSLWAADQQSIVTSQRAPQTGVYSVAVAGGAPQPIALPGVSAGTISVSALSPDGKWLAYLQNVNNILQIFVQPMAEGKPAGEPSQFAPSTYPQRDAEFSPDGRWMAYVTTESNANEVYIQPFPGPGEKHKVSRDGGFNPAWAPDGRQIYYLKPKPGSRNLTATQALSVMAADISSTGDATGHRVLFEGPYSNTTPSRSYDVTSDRQFIFMKSDENPPDQSVTEIHVVLGWGEELKQRVPTASAPGAAGQRRPL